MPAAIRFDPDRIAYFETEGWRAYYDKNYPRGLFLMVQLVREQLNVGWREAIAGAIDIVRAYAAFQPVDGNLFKTRKFLKKFYARAAAPMNLDYDSGLAAQRELEYWIVHRITSLDPNREPLTKSLAELHAVIFGSTVDAMRTSAVHRSNAATAVDRITNRISTDVRADWEEVLRELQLCYRDVLRVSAGGSKLAA